MLAISFRPAAKYSHNSIGNSLHLIGSMVHLHAADHDRSQNRNWFTWLGRKNDLAFWASATWSHN